MSRNDTFDVKVYVHHRTSRAVLVSDDGEDDNAIWMPLSQVTLEPDVDAGTTTLTAPEWLLEEKGLI